MGLRDEIQMDFTEIFSPDELASPAVFTKAGSEPVTICVHFTSAYDLMLAGTAPADGAQPTALCKAVNVSGVRHGDTLAIGDTTFTVTSIHPDGEGLILLVLSED